MTRLKEIQNPTTQTKTSKQINKPTNKQTNNKQKHKQKEIFEEENMH
jgi:hypothetical protein